MNQEHIPAIKSVEDIGYGQAFQFRHRDANYIGIKVFTQAGSDQLPLVAVIWPNHPMTPNEPGIFEPSVLRGKTLVTLPDALLVPSHRMEDTNLDNAANGAAGSILLFEDSAPVMPVRSNGILKFLNLETSELTLDEPGRVTAEIVRWSIVRKILGEFEVIGEFRVGGKP
jgi:hypothetical protein